MRRAFFLILAAAALLAAIPSAHAYRNPVIDNSGDPMCLRDGGWFYTYLDVQFPDSTGGYVRCWRSTDMVNWEFLGPVYNNQYETYNGKTVTGLWSPEVHKIGTKYYMYYVNNVSDETRDICVVEGSSPTDFNDNSTRIKLIDDGASIIDPHIFQDTDNKLYMYFKYRPLGEPSQIRVRPMSGPATFSDAGTILFTSNNVPNSANCIEQPWMEKKNGHYVLFFSYNDGNTTGYKIGYAKATAPKGPFTLSPNNPIMYTGQTSGVIAPGSTSIVWDGSTVRWMVYRQKKTSTVNWDRVTCIDRCTINDQGNVTITATRGTAQINPAPLP